MNHNKRRLYDAEIEELTVLMKHLDAVSLSTCEDDQLIWLGDKKGIFSVKKAYDVAMVSVNPVNSKV